MSKSLPKRVGELFAHVQDLIDTATHTAIKRVDENKKKLGQKRLVDKRG